MDLDRRIAALAETQHGLVARRQALKLGMSTRQIDVDPPNPGRPRRGGGTAPPPDDRRRGDAWRDDPEDGGRCLGEEPAPAGAQGPWPLRQLRQWGYPPAERQIEVRDDRARVLGRVDVGWSPKRIGIEYDSERWHDPTRWAADEERHRAIEAHGWTLLRADKTDLRPGAVDLRRQLAACWLLAA